MNSQRRRSKLRQRDFGLEAFHVERDERLDVASLAALSASATGCWFKTRSSSAATACDTTAISPWSSAWKPRRSRRPASEDLIERTLHRDVRGLLEERVGERAVDDRPFDRRLPNGDPDGGPAAQRCPV